MTLIFTVINRMNLHRGAIFVRIQHHHYGLGAYLCFQAFETLDVEDIMAKQVEQLEKEKKELMDRLKNQEKKVRRMQTRIIISSFLF